MLAWGDPSLPDRFWAKVFPEPNTGCWLWCGSLTGKGYGSFNLGGKPQKTGVAHKMTYETCHGALPATAAGARVVLDHKCRTRCCVNPEHLRPLREPLNVACGISPSALNAKKTHCPKGHAYTPANTYTWRRGDRSMRCCRECRRS